MTVYDPDPEISVRVTKHAQVRFRERYPQQDRHVSDIPAIVHLVLEGIRAGRIAKRKPAWAVFIENAGREQNRRYVWDEDETVVFSITCPRLATYPDPSVVAGRKRWLVMTVLPRQSDEDEARKLGRAHFADRKRRMKNGSWTTDKIRADRSGRYGQKKGRKS